MAFRPLKSFFPTADELLQQDLPRLGRALLIHLKSYEGLNTVWQRAGLNRGYFRAMLENRNVGLGSLPTEPEYGGRQPEVTARMMEAWNWLCNQGLLIPNDQLDGDWFTISSEGQKLLQKSARFEHFEKLGLNRVKSDLEATGGIRDIGGPQEARDQAWEWVAMKEGQANAVASSSQLTLIADSRLAELRKLVSAQFDFRKLIRICEEINTAYSEKCYLATAMLTRGLLDHVPPLFGYNTFSEVANNYGGGGKSFKETIQHLENAARKIADAHLHMPIRKSETLPTAQQVNFGSQLDVLLAEIVRITQ